MRAGSVIELTYNWGVDSYDQGSAFGHIALGVDDVAATCESIRQAGGKISREAGPVKAVPPLLPLLKTWMVIRLN